MTESKNLLIVFVKNIVYGKVKTRLAKTIGTIGAFNIYNELVAITENETQKINIDRHIYFSEKIVSSMWGHDKKYVQEGQDLGERMKNAFLNGFESGYENIVLIGSDLPDISNDILDKAFENLQKNEIVFGPAYDGGYYLVGMSKMLPQIFENKPWSQPDLLDITLQELKKQHQNVTLLKPLNDIDTFEDLIDSNFYKQNLHIQNFVEKLKAS